MISFAMKTLLYSSPKMDFSTNEIAEYNKLISKVYEGQLFPKDLSFPKYRFLQYISLHGDFIFHGSNNLDIDIFKPQEQTLFNGKKTKAVFASSEPIWSMFYAVLDRSKLVGSIRNGCLVYKNKKYHYYSLNKSTMEKDPWTSGKLYILPKNVFKLADNNNIHFDEWISHDFVKPINHLEIHPDDFYFKNRVSTHKKHESNVKTWLLYKYRTLKVKKGKNIN